MSEEQKESPPAGGADGQGNSQKPQAVDNTENKPNGAGEQEDFSGSAARRYPDYVKSGNFSEIQLFRSRQDMGRVPEPRLGRWEHHRRFDLS